jgi:hypothetical protein
MTHCLSAGPLQAELEETHSAICALRSELGLAGPAPSGGYAHVPMVDGVDGGQPPPDVGAATAVGDGDDGQPSAFTPTGGAAPLLPERETTVGNYIVQDQRTGEGLLGTGGMANFESGEGGVFVGRHAVTGELVAVKKMHYAVLCANPQNFERLKRYAVLLLRNAQPPRPPSDRLSSRTCAPLQRRLPVAPLIPSSLPPQERWLALCATALSLSARTCYSHLRNAVLMGGCCHATPGRGCLAGGGCAAKRATHGASPTPT